MVFTVSKIPFKILHHTYTRISKYEYELKYKVDDNILKYNSSKSHNVETISLNEEYF